jgi:hypothetical protein
LLIGAADTSSNWEYVSIIIGVTDDIKRIYKKLDCQGIHMSDLSKKDKNKIIKKLEIKGEVFATCLQVGRFEIVNEINKRISRQTRMARRKYIQDQFDYVFIDKIKGIYREFLNRHSIIINNIIFEIDKDLRNSFSHIGLKYKDPDFTHQIADIIAYCNTKNKTISHLSEINLSEELKNSLSKRLHI